MALQPKQLIRFEKEENTKSKLVYDDVVLKETLSKTGTSKIAVISVTGSARSGKSYLLNCIRQYFNWEQDDDEDWMGWGQPHTNLQGFEWRGGRDPVTLGVWIWPEPLMAQTSNGEVVSVLLIDTQGTLNEFTTKDESIILTALCFLLSTVTVYNVKNDIDYESFQLIKKSLQLCSKVSQKICYLHDLLITIRDWRKENDFDYGVESGRNYLEEKLEIKLGITEDARNYIELIKSSFKHLSCTLFPDPGEKVKARVHKGHLAEMDTMFSATLETIPETFDSDNLYKKAVGSSMEFIKQFESCVNLLNGPQVSDQKQPKQENNIVEIQAFDMYRNKFESHSGELFSAEDVDAIHTPAFRMAMEFLEEKISNTAYRTALEIQSCFHKMVEKYHQTVVLKSEEKGKELKKAINEASNAVVDTYTADITIKVFSKDSVSDTQIIRQHKLLKEEGLSSFSDLIPKKYKYLPYEPQIENLEREIDAKFIEMKENWVARNEARMTAQWELVRPRAIKEYNAQMRDLSDGEAFVDQDTFKHHNEKVQNKILKKHCDDLEYEHLAGKLQEQLKSDLNQLFLELDRINYENMMEAVQGKLEKALLTSVRNYKTHLSTIDQELQLTEEGFSQQINEAKEKIRESFLADIAEEPDNIKADFLTKLNIQCEQQGKEALENFQSTRLQYLEMLEVKKQEIQSELITILEIHSNSNNILIDGKTEEINNDILNQIESKFEKARINLPSSLIHVAQNETAELIKEKFKDVIEKRQTKIVEFNRDTEDILELCFNSYTSKMEDLDNIDSEDLLQQHHANSLNSCIKELKNKSAVKHQVLLQPFVNILKEKISGHFVSDIKKTFNFEREQKYVQQQRAEMEAIKLYRDAMDDYFKEKSSSTPSNLMVYHSKMCTKISNNVASKNKLQMKAKEKLFKSIDREYSTYEALNASNTPTDDPAIGIDLGTTYTCAAIYDKGIARVIPNEKGSFTFPSYVAFTPTGELIGHPAKEMAHMYALNTIFDAKRLIGRKFNDKTVQDDIKNWPFEVINENNVPKIKVGISIFRQKIFAPETISAKILNHVKVIAEKHLGKKINKAVITVPAYFNDGQRQATRDAGEIAGLKVLQIINEPTAAAMAYHLSTRGEGNERNVLVYDLGGGTFDVAILNMKPGGEIVVKSVNGDTHLGGEDFDEKLLEEIVKRYKINHGIDLKAGKESKKVDERANAARILRRLRNACEIAKINISGGDNIEGIVNVAALVGEKDLVERITRKQFENLNMDLFLKTLTVVEKALKDSKLSKGDIHDIVLVGGSTRIPKVQELLSDYFDGKVLRATVNPDEAVACGAAVQAAILNGNQEHNLKKISLKDVTPLSLGTSVSDGSVSTIIKRNSPLPAKGTEDYYTVQDYQDQVLVDILEGEEKLVKDNHLLGEFRLKGIPKKMKGQERILVTMEVNIEGILKVTAVCESTGAKNDVTIEDHRGRLTSEEKRILKQEFGTNSSQICNDAFVISDVDDCDSYD